VAVLAAAGLSTPGLAQKSTTQVQLRIGNQGPILLEAADGGTATAEVLTEKIGAARIQKKHLGKLRYEDLELRLGLSQFVQGRRLFAWVASSWAGQSAALQDGTIMTCGAGKPTSTTLFQQAGVVETAFPALDAGSKEPISLLVKIAVERARIEKAPACAALTPANRELALASNFRFELSGFDPRSVARIDAFAVKRTIATMIDGSSLRIPSLVGSTSIPNLKVYVREAAADAWLKWHKEFVIDGKFGDDHEKAGAVVFLSQDMRKEIARIKLKGVGIFRAAWEKLPAGSTALRRLAVDLYVEEMSLEAK
jgi:hypothetical protein